MQFQYFWCCVPPTLNVLAENQHFHLQPAPEQPGAARSSQEQPGAARSNQEQPGAARSSQEQPGAAARTEVGARADSESSFARRCIKGAPRMVAKWRCRHPRIEGFKDPRISSQKFSKHVPLSSRRRKQAILNNEHKGNLINFGDMFKM